MVKNKLAPRKPIDKAKIGQFLTRLGGGLGRLSSSHPVALGLILMAASSVTLMVARKKEAEGSEWGHRVAAEANGLYQGAQSVALACASIPLIAAGFGAAGGILSAAATPTKVPTGKQP